MAGERVREVDTGLIEGEELSPPFPGWDFQVTAQQDGDGLILRVMQQPRGGEDLHPPDRIAEIHIERGECLRALDVLRAFALRVGAHPELMAQITTLDPVLSREVTERYCRRSV